MSALPVVTWLETTVGAVELAPLWRLLAEQVAADADGRVATRVQHVATDAGGIRTPANRLLSDAVVLAGALAAEPASDGVVVGCWGAPTAAVRSALGIPATTLTAAAADAVPTLVRAAAVVTVAPSLESMLSADLAALGALGFVAERPVRSYDPESTHAEVVDAVADPAVLVDRFDAAAREAIDAGADAIVVGCGYLAPIFTSHGHTHVTGHPDVPIIDCNRLAMEQIIAMLDGPASRLPHPTGDRLDRLRATAALLDPAATAAHERTPTA